MIATTIAAAQMLGIERPNKGHVQFWYCAVSGFKFFTLW